MHNCKNACGPCNFYMLLVWHHFKPLLAVWQGTSKFRSLKWQTFITSVFRSPKSKRRLTTDPFQDISWGRSETCPQRLWSPKGQLIRLWLLSQYGLYNLLWLGMKPLAIVKVFWACNIKTSFKIKCEMNLRCFCHSVSPGLYHTTSLQPQFRIHNISTLHCACHHDRQC